MLIGPYLKQNLLGLITIWLSFFAITYAVCEDSQTLAQLKKQIADIKEELAIIHPYLDTVEKEPFNNTALRSLWANALSDVSESDKTENIAKIEENLKKLKQSIKKLRAFDFAKNKRDYEIAARQNYISILKDKFEFNDENQACKKLEDILKNAQMEKNDFIAGQWLRLFDHNICCFYTQYKLKEDTHPATDIKAKSSIEIKRVNDAPVLYINGKADPFIASFHPDFFSFQAVTEFGKAGIKIHTWMARTMGWMSTTELNDFSGFDGEVKRMMTADPNGLLIPCLHLTPPKDWIKKYYTELTVFGDGARGLHSFASEIYKRDVSKALEAFVEHIENMEWKNKILGIVLCDGHTSEWYPWGSVRGFVDSDYSYANQAMFREWLIHKYKKNIVLLRAAWSNPAMEFEDITIPELEERIPGAEPFLNPLSNKKAIDYFEFISWVSSDHINTLAEIVKRKSNNRLLTGCFYGYVTNATCNNWIPLKGHQNLNSLLDSPYIDFLFWCHDYSDRMPGGAFIPFSASGSAKLHNKLLLFDEDTRSPLASASARYRIETIDKTIEVLKRNLGTAIARGEWGLAYHGFRNNWFSNSEILNSLAEMKNIKELSLSNNPDENNCKDLAVIVSDKTAFYVNPTGCLLRSFVFDQLKILPKTGVAYDTYLIDDLEKIPPSKCYLFLNAFYLSDKDKAAIKGLQRNNNTIIWLFAPGIIDENGFSVENASALTGLNLKYDRNTCIPEIRITNFEHPVTENLPKNTFWQVAGTSTGWIFCEENENTSILGRLSSSGLPGFVLKKFPDWTSIYIAAAPVPANVLRCILGYAGVHIYTDCGSTFQTDGNFAMLHSDSPGSKTIFLPKKSDVYEVYDRNVIARDITQFSVKMPLHKTGLYFIGDLDKIIKNTNQVKPDTALTPESTENSYENILRSKNISRIIASQKPFLPPELAVDGDYSTEWIISKTDQKDEYLDIYFIEPQLLNGISMAQRRNPREDRIKDLEIIFPDGTAEYLTLEDSPFPQQFNFKRRTVKSVRLLIKSTWGPFPQQNIKATDFGTAVGFSEIEFK